MQYTKSIEQWYHSQPGQWLLQLERNQLGRYLAKYYGDALVQYGGASHLFHVMDSPIHFRSYFAPSHGDQAQQTIKVCADFTSPPLLPNSTDVIVLVHVVEYAEHPGVFLKEIYDALIPGGKVLILCFNPWSLWSLQKLSKNRKAIPWCGKFWLRSELKNWLNVIGFNMIIDKTFCFRPPFKTQPKEKRVSFFEAFGQLLCPAFGAVSLLIGEKRVYASVTQQAMQLRQRAILAGRSMAEPTTRQ